MNPLAFSGPTSNVGVNMVMYDAWDSSSGSGGSLRTGNPYRQYVIEPVGQSTNVTGSLGHARAEAIRLPRVGDNTLVAISSAGRDTWQLQPVQTVHKSLARTSADARIGTAFLPLSNRHSLGPRFQGALATRSLRGVVAVDTAGFRGYNRFHHLPAAGKAAVVGTSLLVAAGAGLAIRAATHRDEPPAPVAPDPLSPIDGAYGNPPWE